MSTTSSELNTNIALAKKTNRNDSIKPGMTIKPRRLDGLAKKNSFKAIFTDYSG